MTSSKYFYIVLEGCLRYFQGLIQIGARIKSRMRQALATEELRGAKNLLTSSKYFYIVLEECLRYFQGLIQIGARIKSRMRQALATEELRGAKKSIDLL